MFDIRDVRIDSIENIRTIPLMAGREKAYRIIYFFLVLFVLVSLLQYFRTKNFIQFNAMLISAFATFFMVKISRKQHSDFFLPGMYRWNDVASGNAGYHRLKLIPLFCGIKNKMAKTKRSKS